MGFLSFLEIKGKQNLGGVTSLDYQISRFRSICSIREGKRVRGRGAKTTIGESLCEGQRRETSSPIVRVLHSPSTGDFDQNEIVHVRFSRASGSRRLPGSGVSDDFSGWDWN